jgi:2-dehydropantoate 2-reductase
VAKINHDGLRISGKTIFHDLVPAVTTVDHITFHPDLILLTVKSFDTVHAVKKLRSIMKDTTVLLTFQNGLDNISHIEQCVSRNHIVAGITTHGAMLQGPGQIVHSGRGWTVIGELHGKKSHRIDEIAQALNDVGISTSISTNIIGEIWKKAIINSSINPLTALFQCPNGYLLKNPVLTRIVDFICEESTRIAQSEGVDVSIEEMCVLTRDVISETQENLSSMFQSIQKHKKTEIDSINGALVAIGRNNDCITFLNEMVMYSIKHLTA